MIPIRLTHASFATLLTLAPALPGTALAYGDEHAINDMSNGQFEVVWPNRDCIATFNQKAEAMRFSPGCNDDLISRSHDIARHHVGSGHSQASHSQGTSKEYKRGYNDALKGHPFDQNRHPQDYKDGFRAGEEAR